ncbi:hypothetical protein OEZ85_013725 [Tetradesmus obliquus]|uniref:Peptidase C1A papain C-terminal domain-containing protein n=1 Tax=Tetradesmus obliquus TaxID=3088 RepID=A0ABY8US11_TETOB|nr:hypothetical protein OEZ85_013725 [Tetradesmus obliquus]
MGWRYRSALCACMLVALWVLMAGGTFVGAEDAHKLQGLHHRHLQQAPDRTTGLVYNAEKDTHGRRAFISPAQDQGKCAACVGFAFTAAAEAAVNVYLQQSWSKLNLSEQDVSFCKLWPRVDCTTGMTYEKLLENIIDKRLQKWTSRKCLPYNNGPAWSCGPADACASELPKEEEEDAAAQPAAAGSGAGVDAGAAQDGAVEELVDKASSLRLNAAALTQSQINDRDKWYKLLPPELKKMPHMRTHFNTMYAANADAAHEYVINAREQADQLVSRVNGQEFDLAKALSKPCAAGQLFAGEKAKNNPADVEGWLSSGSFYIAVKGVPEKWQFAYAFFTMLDVDARAVCFPDLKDTQPEQLLDGIYTWQDFCRGVLQ